MTRRTTGADHQMPPALMVSLILAVMSAAHGQEQAKAPSATSPQWVTPIVHAPHLQHRTFDSAAAMTKVSYHSYTELPGIGHNPMAVLNALGEGNWDFYRLIQTGGAEILHRKIDLEPLEAPGAESPGPGRGTLEAVEQAHAELWNRRIDPHGIILDW